MRHRQPVTLPIETAEAVQRPAESGQVESISRYVTETVGTSLAVVLWVFDRWPTMARLSARGRDRGVCGGGLR